MRSGGTRCSHRPVGPSTLSRSRTRVHWQRLWEFRITRWTGNTSGATVAEAVDVISMTHGPTAAGPWLSVIDDLVAEVGLNRTDDPDEALLYRGEVYGTAITAVARAKSTTDEWVHAVARGVLEVTNETAAPHGREAVGGDLEPFATAFTGALARLARPAARRVDRKPRRDRMCRRGTSRDGRRRVAIPAPLRLRRRSQTDR